MRFYTVIKSKKNPLSMEYSYSKINLSDIESILEIMPTQAEFVEWFRDILQRLQSKQIKEIREEDLIHVKTTQEQFEKIVKKLYFKIGKSVEKEDKETKTYKIPMKKNSYFYESIDKILISSEELHSVIIAIHV